MKRFIGIMMAMVMGLCSVGAMNVGAEDKTGTVEAEFYSDDNNYKTRELSYSITIEDNGNVNFVIDKFMDSERGRFYCPNFYIRDSKKILYTNDYSIKNGEDISFYSFDWEHTTAYSSGYAYIYNFSNTYNPDTTVYTDTQGKLFYKKNNEKIYFTDTIIVEFNGITITKEIGNGNSEIQIVDNNPIYGDFNSDGQVNASDAALILIYAAVHGAGSFNGTFEEYIAQN